MKKWLKGSYTVEAAFLFPLILFIITGFIYMDLYLHDKYKIEETLNLAVLKTLAYNQVETSIVTGYIDYEGYINRDIFYRFKSREDKEAVIINYLYTCLNEKLFLTQVKEITVKIAETELEITGIGYVNFPLFGGMTEKDYTLSFHRMEENIINTREFVRMFDVFGEVAEKVPGADNAIKLLQNALETLK